MARPPSVSSQQIVHSEIFIHRISFNGMTEKDISGRDKSANLIDFYFLRDRCIFAPSINDYQIRWLMEEIEGGERGLRDNREACPGSDPGTV